jgi:hypothetical protein
MNAQPTIVETATELQHPLSSSAALSSLLAALGYRPGV